MAIKGKEGLARLAQSPALCSLCKQLFLLHVELKRQLHLEVLKSCSSSEAKPFTINISSNQKLNQRVRYYFSRPVCAWKWMSKECFQDFFQDFYLGRSRGCWLDTCWDCRLGQQWDSLLDNLKGEKNRNFRNFINHARMAPLKSNQQSV